MLPYVCSPASFGRKFNLLSPDSQYFILWFSFNFVVQNIDLRSIYWMLFKYCSDYRLLIISQAVLDYAKQNSI